VGMVPGPRNGGRDSGILPPDKLEAPLPSAPEMRIRDQRTPARQPLALRGKAAIFLCTGVCGEPRSPGGRRNSMRP